MEEKTTTLPVRLAPWEIKVVLEAFAKNYRESDHLWLFGSRADLSKRGGDIDLYIEAFTDNLDFMFKCRSGFYRDLIFGLGDQKIDIVVNNGRGDLPIYAIAKRTGVQMK